MKTVKVVAAAIIDKGKVFATERSKGSFKDMWEFPGGKIEEGESPEEALKREIKEELDTDISVGEHLVDVEYDYPEFHLSMKVFLSAVVKGNLTLLEHEDALWLGKDELDSVNWLPADEIVVDALKSVLV